jgi:hypothetical protein
VVELHSGAPLPRRRADRGRYLPFDDGSDVTHQALGLPKLAVVDRLQNGDETVMELVIDFIGAEMTQQEIADGATEKVVKFLNCGRVPGAHTADQRRAVRAHMRLRLEI